MSAFDCVIDSETLRKVGFLDHDQVLDILVEECQTSRSNVREVLNSAHFRVIKGILAYEGFMVVPSDRSRNFMTDPQIMPLLGAVVVWHRKMTSAYRRTRNPGPQIKLIDLPKLVSDHRAGEKEALDFTPMKLRRKCRRNIAPKIVKLTEQHELSEAA